MDAVVHALSAPHPRASYPVAPAGRRWMTRLLDVLPGDLRDRLALSALR